MQHFTVYKEILLVEEDGVLTVTLNRPKYRNAMNLQMVHEIMAAFERIRDNRNIRVVIIRGSGGDFCAGGDVKDINIAIDSLQATDKTPDADPIYTLNRTFGHMLTQVNSSPQVVITLLEGAVLGGGFGLACISDIAIADTNARFGLPETGLGLPPAQIAPFVVSRIGLTQTRRLALTGAKFNGEEALALGLVHFTTQSKQQMQDLLLGQIAQIKSCGPRANSITKELILCSGRIDQEHLLDSAARHFSAAVLGAEGREGTSAFVEKRAANWSR